MRRAVCICWTGVLLALLASGLYGEDSFRVATYNLNNYLVMDRQVDGHWRPSYPKPEKEKAIIRQILQEVRPDVLILQEMGTVDFLEELRADLQREGLHYPYAVHMRGTDSERHLAVLSNLEPHEVVKHKDLDFKYLDGREVVKRGMLEMSFDLKEGGHCKLFAVHLKSRYTSDPRDPMSGLRRVREAEACRNRIVERTHEMGQHHYLIVGDFNDHPASATLRRFLRRGTLEIGSLVPATDSRGEVWTYHYAKEARYESVDGFVGSPKILPHLLEGSAHIVDRPGALVGSDHRMVYLDLEL